MQGSIWSAAAAMGQNNKYDANNNPLHYRELCYVARRILMTADKGLELCEVAAYWTNIHWII